MVKNLKKLRMEKGISQQALAEKIGISQQSINKYENHKIEPDISTLIAMANYFDTTVDYLVGRTDETGNPTETSPTDVLFEKYRLLDDKEKNCINIIVDTFHKEKDKK